MDFETTRTFFRITDIRKIKRYFTDNIFTYIVYKFGVLNIIIV
jgi:hypothetical protein